MDFVSETFLSEYFLFNCILGDYCNPKIIYSRLSSIFMLSTKKSRELYSLTQDGEVKSITTDREYLRFCRIMRYSESYCSGLPCTVPEVITVKGNALTLAANTAIKRADENTEATVYKSLTSSALNGDLTSLRILGVLQCEGVFVPKNLAEGKKNLEKAAKWNSIEGILAAMYYDSENLNLNARRLYTLTYGTPFEPLYRAAKDKYGFDGVEKLPEVELLEKAFGAKILRRETYIPKFARILFTDVIKFSDKEKLVFSTDKGAISESGDLPLKLKFREISCDKGAFSNLPLIRADEQSKILQSLENYDLCRESFYRPVCLCSESDYVINMYAKGVMNYFAGAHIQRIDVANIADYDLEPVQSHVFIRSCNEDKANVYLLVLKGDISDKTLTEVKNFLKSDMRKKFRLVKPAVEIDLSAVLPVCLCDNENAAKLYNLCDVINLSAVSKSEKSAAVKDVFEIKKRLYGVDGLTIHKDAYEKLYACSMESVESALDKGVRFNRKKSGKTVITCEQIKEYISAGSPNSGYGFGGAYSECK